MRLNSAISAGYCQWCQGDQEWCHDKDICAPPSPCWGAQGPETAAPKYFPHFTKMTDPDGNLWVDPTGGLGHKTVWCPGKNYTINGYINADHNGVYRWEAQLSEPGKEIEKNFKNFTSWTPVNQDNNTRYYINGTTLVPPEKCFDGNTVTYNTPHCRDGGWFQTNLTIPESLPIGNTVIRWIWYGGMDPNQTKYFDPEHSLFVNCVDVIIGNETQCSM